MKKEIATMSDLHAAERASLKSRAELRRIARANGLKKHYPRAGWAWDLEAAAKLK